MAYNALEESSSTFTWTNDERTSSDNLTRFQNTATRSGEMFILRGMKGWKKMWFMLRGESLLIFKEKSDPIVHKEIQLSGAKIEEDLKVKRQFTMHIETSTPKKKHHCISCNTKLEVTDWITALQEAAGPNTSGLGMVHSKSSLDSLSEMQIPDPTEARKQKRRTAGF